MIYPPYKYDKIGQTNPKLKDCKYDAPTIE